ncbi:MAG TPA: hypothetical protein VGK67_01855 [Myxococcales bacterium]|jgi:hypothetical protein
MTKFIEKTFSVSVASGGISDEELARRWEETFGKKEEQDKAGKIKGRRKPTKKKG